MADQENNIGDLSQVKQLTSSIRFDSEAVRVQVEQMLTRYQDVADILGKTRELTRSETAFAKEYLATVSRLADPLKRQADYLTDSSKALVAMEQAAARYTATVEKAQGVSDRLAGSLKGARKAQESHKERAVEAEGSLAAASQRQTRYGELASAVATAKGGGDDSKLRDLLGDEAKGKSRKEVRKIGAQKLGAERDAVAGELGVGKGDKEVANALRAQVDLHEKILQAAKKEADQAAKRVDQLKSQRKLVGEIKDKNEAAAKAVGASISAHEKLLPKLQKRFGAAEPPRSDGDEAAAGGGGRSGGSGGYGTLGRRGLMNNIGLNVLSDVGLPGISSLARVERYRRMTSDAADRWRAKRAEDQGDESGGGGLMGGAVGLMKSPVGLAVGGLAVAGGAAVAKFREAMGEAEGMAGPQRTLMGQAGYARARETNRAIGDGSLSRYGLDARGAQGALISLNRSVGGQAGASQLKPAAALGQAFGQDAGEVGGHAGALMRAGGASPLTAVKSLEKIMLEGVKAGMDRARITEFTSEVVNLQEQILHESGENNAQAIARSLAAVMGASGKQGQEFLQGAGYQGLMGMDRSMRGFARGGGGMGMGTLYRAFAPGVGGQTPGDRYVGLNEKLEGGLFGGKGDGDNAPHRARQVISQYFKESGAGELFDRRSKGEKLSGGDERQYKSAENVVRTRMQMEMGVGYGQSKELLKIMENIDRKMATPEGQRELENVIRDMSEKQKDPLVALGDKMAEANRSLQAIAMSGKAIQGFMAVKDVEIAVNRAAKPVVEAGGEMFGSAVDSFGKAVKSFEEGVNVIRSVFGDSKATPEETKAMDDTLRQLTGKGLEEFKDSGGFVDSLKTMFQGIMGRFGGGSDAAPPRPQAAAKVSATNVPMTPDSLRAIMAGIQKAKDEGKPVDAQAIVSAIREGTAATQAVGAQLRQQGKNPNIGGVARGK